MATNNIKFNVKNGLAVGASGFPVINTNAEWIGTSQSPYGATGPRGETGATGATGYIGVNGATGATGTDGATGYAGATGQQGHDGASGAQGLTGATGAQGDLGDTGVTGDNGVQGDTGVQGPDGVLGQTGPQGDQGIEGASGTVGLTGDTGQVGATGDHGDRYHTTSTTTLNLTTGATGVVVVDDQLNYSSGQTILLADGGGKHIHATVTSWDANTKILGFTPIDHVGTGSSSSWEINLDGAEGPAGATGVTGLQGDQGPQGDQGFQGLVGATGETGPQGSQGIDGASGVTGATGQTGLEGDQGPQGEQGVVGATGHTGVQGDQGVIGEDGLIGDQGIVGHDGATGVIGATGQQGGDGSTAGETIYRFPNWTNLYYVGSSNAYGAAILAFHPANTVIYDALAALQVGDSITIDFTASGQTSPQTVTVTETITADGIYNPYKIKVSASPNNDPSAQINGDDNLDNITLPGTGPTNIGSTGLTGPQGEQGPEGNQGASGVTGQDGATGVFGQTGVTGDTGVTGTDGASGVTGASGPTGETGTDGASGVTGTIGETGPQGDQGVIGATGHIGASGATGEVGVDGATGYHGLQFKASASGNFSVSAIGTPLTISFAADPQTGYTSYSYSTGQTVIISYDINNYMVADITNVYGDPVGSTIDVTVTKAVGTASSVSGWEVNLDGAVGEIGASGATGFTGATGVLGQTGPQGDTGVTGDQGIVGASGVEGIQGASGATGVDGASGTVGLDGDQGQVGATGYTGATGSQGIGGASGIAGATGYGGLTKGSTGLSGTGSNQTIDIFAANDIATAKYLVQGVDGSTNVQATQVILTQNTSGLYMTEYATLKTGAKVMDVTATTNGSVVELKVTPTVSNTVYNWVRESVRGRIGGTTLYDTDNTHTFISRTNSDNGAIPVGKAYVYPGSYWTNLLDFYAFASTNASLTFDDAGVGPQSPAVGTVDSWDGGTLIVTIVSGNFTSRNSLDKITYGY